LLSVLVSAAGKGLAAGIRQKAQGLLAVSDWRTNLSWTGGRMTPGSILRVEHLIRSLAAGVTDGCCKEIAPEPVAPKRLMQTETVTCCIVM
jgi:hypothetical protein